MLYFKAVLSLRQRNFSELFFAEIVNYAACVGVAQGVRFSRTRPQGQYASAMRSWEDCWILTESSPAACCNTSTAAIRPVLFTNT